MDQRSTETSRHPTHLKAVEGLSESATRFRLNMPEMKTLCDLFAAAPVIEHKVVVKPVREPEVVPSSNAEPPRRRPVWGRQRLHGFSAPLVVGAVAALSLVTCMVTRWQESVEERGLVQEIPSQVVQAREERAREAFNSGDYHASAVLLESISRNSALPPRTGLLYARSLECLGQYRQAVAAYGRLAEKGQFLFTARRALVFCKRMATERSKGDAASREADYRLHSELLRRGEASTARFIARRLLPDAEPMRAAIAILLANSDPQAKLTLTSDRSRADVVLYQLTPEILDLLSDLPLGRLTLSGVRLSDTHALARLDVRELNLSLNPLSDLSGVHALHPEWLDLSDTAVADVHALSDLPLRELNLAHSSVGSLAPLAHCPLEKLDLTGLPIHEITALRSIALHKLVLSRTEVKDLSPLASLPLQELAVDGTLISDLQPLAGMKLTRLNLAGTAVKDLSPLKGMPLVEIDLHGCSSVTDLTPLLSCPGLERVILPAQLRGAVVLNQLPRLRFIEFEQPQRLGMQAETYTVR